MMNLFKLQAKFALFSFFLTGGYFNLLTLVKGLGNWLNWSLTFSCLYVFVCMCFSFIFSLPFRRMNFYVLVASSTRGFIRPMTRCMHVYSNTGYITMAAFFVCKEFFILPSSCCCCSSSYAEHPHFKNINEVNWTNKLIHSTIEHWLNLIDTWSVKVGK